MGTSRCETATTRTSSGAARPVAPLDFDEQPVSARSRTPAKKTRNAFDMLLKLLARCHAAWAAVQECRQYSSLAFRRYAIEVKAFVRLAPRIVNVEVSEFGLG